MSTVIDQVTTCSTFVRLDQYYTESSRRWSQISLGSDAKTATPAARREQQEALNAKSRASEMLSRHSLECPICRLVRS